MSFAQIQHLLTKTYQEFNADQAPRMAAALAYYTTLSLAPLLVLTIAVAGLVFGQEAAQGRLVYQIRDMVGIDGAKAIEDMIAGASKPASGIVATVLGFGMLAFGASSVATELRNSLNILWKKSNDADAGITTMLKERSYALAVVLGCGFLLLVSLAISSAIAAAGQFIAGFLPQQEFFLQLFNFCISVAIITGVFAVLFKYLPERDIEWRDVLLGALFTSVLFNVGKMLIGLYLGKASLGSSFGAAGSLVILLVWLHYSSQIFFFGATFTQVYASTHGSDPISKQRVTPSPVMAQISHVRSSEQAG